MNKYIVTKLYHDEFGNVKMELANPGDAIPIDWIEKWGQQFYKIINGRKHYMGDGYDSIWDMLEDWKKENEESN